MLSAHRAHAVAGGALRAADRLDPGRPPSWAWSPPARAGLLIFHRFNLISVAFIPLFVGLGIDFGIQFSVR